MSVHPVESSVTVKVTEFSPAGIGFVINPDHEMFVGDVFQVYVTFPVAFVIFMPSDG